jgi:2-desacetyl-2-hydroxyethyl bacteriochlorophyllide A dehydrogenase
MHTEDMGAGIWSGPGEISFGRWPKPVPKPDEVLVKIAYCGFCGSDGHIVDGTVAAGRPPQVIGHEVSGTIVEVGDAVRDLAPGDRVACNLYGYCGTCAWCRSGQPNFCKRPRFGSAGFSEYAVYRASMVFKLPAEITLETGAFLEPVATAVHAVDIGEIKSGEHVLVIGAGPLGLICAQLSALVGAATVTVSDPRESSRALALTLGATRVVDPVVEDLPSLASTASARGGYDVIFEVAAAAGAATQAPALAATGGRVVFVGVFPEDVTIPVSPFLLYQREVSLRAANAAPGTFERALDLLGRLHLDPLVSAVEPLERIAQVYADHKRGVHMKVLVSPLISVDGN